MATIREAQIQDAAIVSEYEFLKKFRLGYTEPTYTGGKISFIIEWQTSDKLKKFQDWTITRTGDLISSISSNVYQEADGVTVIGTLTYTVARNADNSISNITTTRTGF